MIDRAGAVAAALTAILYGTSYVATGIALRSFGPLTLATLRGALGWLVLVVFLLLGSRSTWPRHRLGAAAARRLLALGLLGGPVFLAAMNLAVDQAGATVTSFVAGSYAVLAAVLGVPVLRERLSIGTILALTLALAGTALLAELRLSAETLPGVAWGLAASLAFGLFLVLTRRWSEPFALDSPVVALATLTLTPLGAGALTLIGGGPRVDTPIDPSAALAVAWLAAGPGATAAMLVTVSMRRLSAARASAFLLLNPPVATAGAALLLGERLSPLQLLGGALILVAIGAATRAWRLVPGLRP
ncbi:MAG TPA: DMT family transporter [candidate division Zixibacteria bacterium]|nr:DMT family transporter [candidate division Zixibacteria bacterium]